MSLKKLVAVVMVLSFTLSGCATLAKNELLREYRFENVQTVTNEQQIADHNECETLAASAVALNWPDVVKGYAISLLLGPLGPLVVTGLAYSQDYQIAKDEYKDRYHWCMKKKNYELVRN